MATTSAALPAWRRNLLWIDGLGGAGAGVAVLGLSAWLSAWYGLPPELVLVIGGANLAFGIYSLSLASRRRRPLGMIVFLAVANATWTLICLTLIVAFWQPATWLGIAHLAIEGLYVGGLAGLEWRWRHVLVER